MNFQQLALISDFVTVDHGKYIVKVSVFSDGVILGSALASGDTVEKAEDEARKRVITLVTNHFSLNIPESSAKTVNIKSSPRIQSSTEKETNKSSIKSIKTEEKLTNEIKNQENNDLWSNNPLSLPDEQSIIENNEIVPNKPSLFDSESYEENNGKTLENNLISYPEDNVENLSTEIGLPLGIEFDETMDFSDIIDQTSIEMKRLGWTQDQGKKYLLETYGKKSRHLLSDQELIEFLSFLKTQ